MRTYLIALLVVAGCKGKAEEKKHPLVQHKDLGALGDSRPARPAPDPVPAPTIAEEPTAPQTLAPWPNAPAGSRMVGDWSINSLGVGPGFVYGCAGGQIRAAPKAGGPVVARGTCGHAFNFLSDGASMFWCDDDGPMMLPPRGAPVALARVADSCIAAAVDESHFYYIVPAFEGVPNAGLYRIAKDGGEPSLLLPTRKGVQLMVALDADSIWIGSWGAGTISRMKKSGGGATVVVSGQKGIVELLSSSEDLYWYSERNEEIRKRAKRGGAITTVATGVTSEPVELLDGTLYWTSWESREHGSTSALYRLRPGADEPAVLMRGLRGPDFRVDESGLYVTQMDEVGVLAIPHLDR